MFAGAEKLKAIGILKGVQVGRLLSGGHTLLVGNSVKIEVVHNDITGEKVGAITNAANSHLVHRGGVAGAIVRKGGRSI